MVFALPRTDGASMDWPASSGIISVLRESVVRNLSGMARKFYPFPRNRQPRTMRTVRQIFAYINQGAESHRIRVRAQWLRLCAACHFSNGETH